MSKTNFKLKVSKVPFEYLFATRKYSDSKNFVLGTFEFAEWGK